MDRLRLQRTHRNLLRVTLEWIISKEDRDGPILALANVDSRSRRDRNHQIFNTK